MSVAERVGGFEANPGPVSGLLAGLEEEVILRPEGPLRFVRRPGVTEDALEGLRRRMARPLLGTFVDTLRLSDGFDLYGVEVFGTRLPESTNPEDAAELYGRRVVPFHDWGNGDFDVVDLTKVVGDEPMIAFYTAEMDTFFPIAPTFARWICMAAVEVEMFGRLLHPRDYLDPRFANAQGVYETVANVKKTFYGDGTPEALGGRGAQTAPPPPPEPGPERRRDRLKGWLKGRFGR